MTLVYDLISIYLQLIKVVSKECTILLTHHVIVSKVVRPNLATDASQVHPAVRTGSIEGTAGNLAHLNKKP